jgi:hypothetical protein
MRGILIWVLLYWSYIWKGILLSFKTQTEVEESFFSAKRHTQVESLLSIICSFKQYKIGRVYSLHRACSCYMFFVPWNPEDIWMFAVKFVSGYFTFYHNICYHYTWYASCGYILVVCYFFFNLAHLHISHSARTGCSKLKHVSEMTSVVQSSYKIFSGSFQWF